MFACQEGFKEIAKLLIERGTNLEIRSEVSGHNSYLYRAPTWVQFSLDIQDGETALIIASNKGRTDIVTMLLDRGANINAQTKVSVNRFHENFL